MLRSLRLAVFRSTINSRQAVPHSSMAHAAIAVSGAAPEALILKGFGTSLSVPRLWRCNGARGSRTISKRR